MWDPDRSGQVLRFIRSVEFVSGKFLPATFSMLGGALNKPEGEMRLLWEKFSPPTSWLLSTFVSSSSLGLSSCEPLTTFIVHLGCLVHQAVHVSGSVFSVWPQKPPDSGRGQHPCCMNTSLLATWKPLENFHPSVASGVIPNITLIPNPLVNTIQGRTFLQYLRWEY